MILLIKYFISIFYALVIFSTTSLYASEQSVTLQLPWSHQFQFAGYYAAIEQGFYKDVGLKVSLREGKPGLTPVDEVSSRRVEYGVARSDILAERMRGVPITVLASIYQHSAIIFLSTKKSGITTPIDMAGHRVMLKQGISAAEHLAVLKKAGLSENKIIRQVSSYNVDDLIAGKTDVFNAYITNEPFYLEEQNIPYSIIRPSDYGIDFYGDVLFTNEQEITDNPQQVKAFRKASLQGWRYALENSEEIIDLIISKYAVSKSRASLRFEAEGVRKLIMPELVEIGYVNPERWQNIADIFVQLEMAPSSYSLDGFIYDPNPSANQFVDMHFLNEEDKKYLKEKKVIKMCNNPNWAPIEFAEDGDFNKMQGIAIDTLKVIEEQLQIKFKNVPTKSWNESQQFLKERKCDILPSAVQTSTREKYANFTKPYLKLPLAIFTTKEKQVISGLDGVMDKSWTRQKGSGLITKLKAEYPDMKVIETKGDQEALQAVNKGNAYFTIATLPVASHVISKFLLNDLHIAGYTDMVYELSIAVRNDDVMLLNILNKSLDNISKDTSKKIFGKWVKSIVKEPITDFTILIQVIALASLIILFCAYRQHILNKNIVQLKTTKRLVKAEKERLQAITENIPGVVFQLYVSNKGETGVHYVSPKMFQIFGLELVGTPSLSLQKFVQNIHKDDQQSWIDSLDDAVESLTPWQWSGRYLKPSGEVIWFEGHSTPTVRKNEILFDGIFIDITNVKKLEEEKYKAETRLQRAQKMEAIGNLAGGVAHDLNNILSGIVGYPELLLQTLPKESELRKPLEAIHDSGKRAATVVADMLTVARGAASIREIHNLNVLIEEYLISPECKELKSLYPEVIFQSTFQASHSTISCSPVHVKKCLMNLVTNAAEAVGKNGIVTVSTHNKHVEKSPGSKQQIETGEYVVLSVLDTGSGISDIDSEHIFEPFYTTKTMGRSGTGLGLAIVWNTMLDHKGNVLIDSSKQGTRFQLYFPGSEHKVIDQAGNDKTEGLTGTNEHILIVDDEPQLQDLASQMLKIMGYKVDSVCSGELALKFIQENPVELIILDMLMEPGMNGLQTYEEILKLYPNQKAVVASGFSESDDVKATLKLGASGFIKKPYSIAKLGRVVKDALSS